jgi:hypothetical protein
MAQATDYNIANQSGANFRAELNTILAAVVSQNSGSSAPTTTYAYQLWIDTGASPNPLLKLRNGANSAWITIGDVTVANLGLAALSGATFTGDITLNAQSDLRFADSDSSNWVALQAPATVSSNVTWTLPATDGSSSQALSTNGSGVLSWASFAALATAQTFTAAQRGTISALTDGATITADFALANNFSVTLGGSRTLANPSNLTAGQSGAIWITQDGTGSRTLAYGSYWDFTGGTAPTLTTTAAARDCLIYAVQSTTQITATLITNLS